MSNELTFGDRVRKLRVQRGWSMTRLAEEIGCSATSICHWEKGETVPQLEKVCDLAAALHTTVEALCGRAEYCKNREVMDLKKENLRLKKALTRIRAANLDICDEIRETLFPDPLMKGENE